MLPMTTLAAVAFVPFLLKTRTFLALSPKISPSTLALGTVGTPISVVTTYKEDIAQVTFSPTSPVSFSTLTHIAFADTVLLSPFESQRIS